MRVARRGADVLELSVEVTERGNASAASDGVTAAHLIRAGVEGALANVEINLSSVRDREVVVRMRAQVQQLRGQATRSLQAAGEAFRRRLAG